MYCLRALFSGAVIVIILLAFGCSSNKNPVDTAGHLSSNDLPLIGLRQHDGVSSALGLLGAYYLLIDTHKMSAELVSKRSLSIGESYIVSGMGFFTITPCSDCLYLRELRMDSGNLMLNFGIDHPFDQGDLSKPPSASNRLDLNVYDLACLIHPHDIDAHDLPLLGAQIYADIVANASGYTTELNEVISDPAALPFVLVIDDAAEDQNTWNEFEMGASTDFDVSFVVEPGGSLIFDMYLTMGYGASAVKSGRLDPKYCNPEFNRKAAWRVDAYPTGIWLDDEASLTTDIHVEVYDWQTGANVYSGDNFADAAESDVYASSEVSEVSVEVLGLMSGAITVPGGYATETGMPGDPLVYDIPVANENLADPGMYIGVVKVTDERSPLDPDQNRDFLIHTTDGINLMNYSMPEYATYQTFTAEVVHHGITLQQVDYDINGVEIPNSAFGSVEIGYLGPAFPKYFNLSINGRWAIQNVPLLAHAGDDVPQKVTMGFDLGVAHGVDVTSVSAGWSFDDFVRVSAPVEIASPTVEAREVSGLQGYMGLTDDEIDKIAPDPEDEYGANLESETSFAVHGSGFPNQDCGKGECVPTAVSNSLKWLQAKKGKPPKGKDTSIKKMKKAVEYDEKKRMTYGGWEDKKKNYMNNNGYNIGTEKYPNGNLVDNEANSTDCDNAMQALRDGKDVEMQGQNHVAALVGAAKLANGCYVFYVAHDTNQGKKGGTVIEKVIYCPNDPSPKARGCNTFFAGKKINGFVAEYSN